MMKRRSRRRGSVDQPISVLRCLSKHVFSLLVGLMATGRQMDERLEFHNMCNILCKSKFPCDQFDGPIPYTTFEVRHKVSLSERLLSKDVNTDDH